MNWAVVGVGNIAEIFMRSMAFVSGTKVIAAYGRTKEKLDQFCDKWKIERRYSDYRELLRQRDIDIVYIATPHIVHYKDVMQALYAKKHVLCEKPMAMSCDQTKEMVAEAGRQNVFLMEAMWTRFFPLVKWFRNFLEEGTLGCPLNINAEFSFDRRYDANDRFFNKELGGGCMRSAGIYPVAFATMLFEKMPDHVAAFAEMRNGVDLRTAAILQFPGERAQTAELYTGFQGQSACIANIAFEHGTVVIPEFYHPDTAYVIPPGQGVVATKIEYPYEGPGLQFEIQAVMDCIRSGARESGIMPLNESIEIAKILDLIYETFEQNGKEAVQ